MKKKILIEGMNCGHCVNHVKAALEDLGAKNIDVNLEKKSATAEVSEISDKDIELAIEDAGYDVISIENI